MAGVQQTQSAGEEGGGTETHKRWSRRTGKSISGGGLTKGKTKNVGDAETKMRCKDAMQQLQ